MPKHAVCLRIFEDVDPIKSSRLGDGKDDIFRARHNRVEMKP